MVNVGMRDDFTLTGIEIETLLDGGFHSATTEICGSIGLDVSLSQRRSRAHSDKLTPGELTQLRGVSGSANGLENQTRPDLCVSTSLSSKVHMHQQRWLTHVNQTNSFDCVDSTQTCQFEFLRFPLDDLTFVGFW